MGEYVRITEVAPRDGLQNEPRAISTREKLELIEAIVRTGVDEVELTSFVSPKWLPQLRDADEVLAGAADFKPEGIVYSVLVPNIQGLRRALEVNERSRALDKIAVFTAASETFSARNVHATIEESIERFRPVVDEARSAGLTIRGYISCAIACPFEGPIKPEAVARVAARLLALGVDEIDLGDTIGASTPATIRALVETIYDRLGDCRETQIGEPCLTLHLHDTRGRAAECVRTALELGVRSFDSSAAGLGGCPFASAEGRRAPGNIDTRTLVLTVEEAGFATGVDPKALNEASEIAASMCGNMCPRTGPAEAAGDGESGS